MEKKVISLALIIIVIGFIKCSLKKEKIVSIDSENLVNGIIFKVNDYIYLNGYSSGGSITFPGNITTDPNEEWNIVIEKSAQDTILRIISVCYLYMPKNQKNSNVSLSIAIHSFQGKGIYDNTKIDNTYSVFYEKGEQSNHILFLIGQSYFTSGYINITSFDWNTMQIKGNFVLSFEDNDGHQITLNDGYFIKK